MKSYEVANELLRLPPNHCNPVSVRTPRWAPDTAKTPRHKIQSPTQHTLLALLRRCELYCHMRHKEYHTYKNLQTNHLSLDLASVTSYFSS
jgi:hypothetical protein